MSDSKEPKAPKVDANGQVEIVELAPGRDRGQTENEKAVEIYQDLLKQGVQEAEARDRAALALHPGIEQDPEAIGAVSPAERVRARSRKERAPAIKAALDDAEKVSKRMAEVRKAKGINDRAAQSKSDKEAEKATIAEAKEAVKAKK